MTPKIKISFVSATALAATFGLAACSGSSTPAPNQSAQTTTSASSDTTSASTSPSPSIAPVTLPVPQGRNAQTNGLSLTLSSSQQVAPPATAKASTSTIYVSGGTVSIEVRGPANQVGNKAVLVHLKDYAFRAIDQTQTMTAVEGGSYAKITFESGQQIPKYIVYTIKPSGVTKNDKPNFAAATAASGQFRVLVEKN